MIFRNITSVTQRHSAFRQALIAAVVLLSAFAAPRAAAYDASHYSTTSRLATGKWVKVKVADSGIYAITASDAQSWGLGSLADVRVFGYGGASVPEVFSADFPDDLPQVPVVRTDDRILFYAQGTVSWEVKSLRINFTNINNPYSTEAYYFVTSNPEIADLTVEQSTAEPSGSEAVTSVTARLLHEVDLVNPGETGRMLLGEDFRTNTSQTFSFDLTGKVADADATVLTVFSAKAQGGEGCAVDFTCNGTPITSDINRIISPVKNVSHGHYNSTEAVRTARFDGEHMDYTVRFTPDGLIYLARLDKIVVNYPRKLSMANGAFGYGVITERTDTRYELSGVSDATQVWDVTAVHKPKRLNLQVNGTTAAYSPDGTGHREYYLFNTDATYPSPEKVQDVANQDLHAMPVPDMIIISPTEYLQQAGRIAAMHEQVDSMRVMVVDQNKVFNEFSCGAPDALAYRMMCKYFYDRGTDEGGHRLGYLLLFGNGTYDNRQISEVVKANSYPMLLTWQSKESSSEDYSFTTDDGFGILGDDTGVPFDQYKMSISVGRFPVKSVTEARTCVDKLLSYVTKPEYGTWRTNAMMVADDENNAVHMEQTESMINNLLANGGEDFIYDKVYIDAFTSVSNGGGRNYPDARKKMFDCLNEGILWWNYVGHAGNTALTADGLLTSTDVADNLFYRHLPVLYTATCEFTRYDANSTTSGEKIFLNSRGGAIALISTPRLVYIPNNGRLTSAVGNFAFSRDENGQPRRIGDILRLAKNTITGDENNLRYFVFGDPAMRLAYPEYTITVDKINGTEVSDDNMPVFKARQTLTFSGRVVDINGNKVSNFDGDLISTLFDCEQSVVSHGYGSDGVEFAFQDRSNKLAVTRNKVTGGEFSFEVTVPSEIIATFDNYSPARICLYAFNEKTARQALGSNDKFFIYGFDETVVADTIGPDITYLGLNSEKFVDGDRVNESPLVMASLSDDSGINFSSSGIGHNITLTLDDKVTYSDVSTYYTPAETEKGSAGTIVYQLENLENGHHTLKLKAWDVFSNSSEKTISFNVMQGLKPDVVDVYTDANPASVQANFYVTHNRPDATLHFTIEIFDMMGREVWRSAQTGRSNLFTTFPITWDLTDFAGRRVPRGIYIYRATISADGEQTSSKAKRIAVTGE